MLVSSICKCIDEELPEDDAFGDAASAWSKDGVAKAVEMILKESSPLFESLVLINHQYNRLSAVSANAAESHKHHL